MMAAARETPIPSFTFISVAKIAGALLCLALELQMQKPSQSHTYMDREIMQKFLIISIESWSFLLVYNLDDPNALSISVQDGDA